MALDDVARTLASYEDGALTDSEFCVGVYIGAADADPAAVLALLSPAMRDEIVRNLDGVDARKQYLFSSSCGRGPPEQEKRMRRGIVALQRAIADAR